MTRTEKAISLFSRGYNCAQSVFYAFADELGIDESMAKNIALGFGGGMGRLQHTCGAVTGAIMVLGLHYGSEDGKDIFSKEKVFLKVQEFVKDFERIHNTVNCGELLGIDMNTDEGMSEAKEKNLFMTKCIEYIKYAIRLLEEKYVA